MRIGGKDVEVVTAGSREAPMVILNTVRGEGTPVYKRIRWLTDVDFTFVSIGGLDWNRDMSPWASPPIYPKEEPFAGGADDYLRTLTDTIIPTIVQDNGLQPEYMMISGYSMAGLFAVYSAYRTDKFSRVVSASGSLWFPGFMDFVCENEMRGRPDSIYLSLGDKEAKTRNQLLCRVQENTERLAGLYSRRGIPTRFEMNPGNHFTEPGERMAKGIAYALGAEH